MGKHPRATQDRQLRSGPGHDVIGDKEKPRLLGGKAGLLEYGRFAGEGEGSSVARQHKQVRRPETLIPIKIRTVLGLVAYAAPAVPS
jgi:hypothetical protein